MSTVRLLSAPGPKAGTYEAGVELKLPAGAHTYWKMPGDSGVPPVFSFNGSKNVDRAEIAFPVPQRISEEGLTAFGYATTVVFPVHVTPKDSARPAALHVDVTYAVCNKICVPAHGDATLTLEPGGKGDSATTVETALAALPAPMSPEESAHLALVRDKGATKPTWTVTWTGGQPIEDVFADAPEGFYFDTKKLTANSWSLTAASVVTTPKATSVPVSLTLKRNLGGLLAMEHLDVGATTQ